MKYETLINNTLQFESFCGVSIKQFDIISSKFDKIYTNYFNRFDFNGNKRKRKNRICKNSVFKCSKDALVFILSYLNQRKSQEHHAGIYKMRVHQTNLWIHFLLKFLNRIKKHIPNEIENIKIKTKQKRFTDTEKINIIKLYKSGRRPQWLAKKFKVTDVAIRCLLNREDVELRSLSESHWWFDINEGFFDKIDTEEKAYFLGILYADGCNKRPRNIVTIFLKEEDVELIKKLNRLIYPKKPIVFDKSPTYTMVGIRITNQRISERLEELGMVKAKTFKLVFPDWLKKGLYPHFIRGYFDGDGYIGTTKGVNKKGCKFFKDKISITGTEMFCHHLTEIFKKEININCSIGTRHPERNHNIRTISIDGRHQVAKLGNYMYKNSTIKLKRKYKRYFKILTRKTKTQWKQLILD
jgi:hypothetical protein